MSATVRALRTATNQAIKALHLEPFKRVTVRFDPFHGNATPVRDFLFIVNIKEVRLTNPDCAVKTEVVCDRSEPSIEIAYSDGRRALIRCGQLTGLEVLQATGRLAGERKSHGQDE